MEFAFINGVMKNKCKLQMGHTIQLLGAIVHSMVDNIKDNKAPAPSLLIDPKILFKLGEHLCCRMKLVSLLWIPKFEIGI